MFKAQKKKIDTKFYFTETYDLVQNLNKEGYGKFC